VDVSNVAIGKLSQAALELNVNLDLLVGDAAEYKFEPTRFDLIVLFYHLDRNLFPKLVSALKPGGLLNRGLGYPKHSMVSNSTL
jgi:SAM-dependent methyltransferase